MTRVDSRVRGVEEGGVGTPWKGRNIEGRRLREGGVGVADFRVLVGVLEAGG